MENDDPYDIDLRMCDDEGMVSFSEIQEDPPTPTLDPHYMARHLRLQEMTSIGREYIKRHPEVFEKPWACTGHAHLAGIHIRCNSPAHR